MSRLQKQKLIFWIAGSLGLSLMFGAMLRLDWLETVHLKFSNFFYWSGHNQASSDIVIVAIDNKSFALKNASELGTLQFSKADYARVIDNLEQAGAAVIGVDVIFSEISAAEDRAVLAATLLKNDNVILAAEPKTGQTYGLKPLEDFSAPHPENLAAILFSPDRDDVVRRQQITFDDPQAPTAFAVRILQRYFSLLPEDSADTPEGYRLMPFAVRAAGKRFEPITVPHDADGRFVVNFFGPPQSFPSISFSDVHQGVYADRKTGRPIDLKDKIVLIGEMGTGIHDEQYVPISFGTAMPGVEIHANALQTILSQRFLSEQTPWGAWVITALVAFAALALFLVLSVGPSLAVLAAGLAGYTVLSWVLFEYGLIVNTVYPILALGGAFVAAYVFRYFAEERAARKTETAFSRYVSGSVVKKILENPDQLKLGGEKKELTVFFSDIANFTTISETLHPEALVDLLNEYLDEMSEVVFDEEGTVDKFIGDALMAFWGAPIAQPDHALRACRAALAYQRKLKTLRKRWTAEKKIPIQARVGINTGEMIVGNIGSGKRFDYTVIGDNVNFGSRLEGLNKYFGTLILISENTHAAAKDHFETREVDLVQVKGKTVPVRIYELLSEKGKLDPLKAEIVKHFEEGLRLYRAQDWKAAIAAFETALKLDILDGPSKTYLARCGHLQQEKLPKHWDGVYVFKSK